MEHKINISISLNWPSYEDDISHAIRETVLDEVRKETRKQAIELRGMLAKSIREKVGVVDIDSVIKNALKNGK